MGRKNYRRGGAQRSKRARQHRKEALHAGLWGWLAHPSHISWRKNRNGHPLYKVARTVRANRKA